MTKHKEAQDKEAQDEERTKSRLGLGDRPHTQGSILIAMLMHAASNAASKWESVVVSDAGLELPRAGVAGFLLSTTWNNTIGYTLVALLLIVLTRGRLGAGTPSDGADASANG